jgi:hypothetical protein
MRGYFMAPKRQFHAYPWSGVLVEAAFTAVIAATSANLAGFQIVGKTVLFALSLAVDRSNGPLPLGGLGRLPAVVAAGTN